ncbi:MAG: hypothetical protein U1D55_10300 [Phycisphaerae bacterium]
MRPFPFLAALALASSSFAHIHLTVDTANGQAGDPILIGAGYLPAESMFTIDSSGRLLESGNIAVFDVIDSLTQPGSLVDGWFAGDEVLLTSDFYFATGRLDGGNFQYELSGLTAIGGGGANVGWGDFGASGFSPSALSNAATRLGRSFDTQVGGHDHEQGYAISGPGLYDLRLVAWDSNGRYTDSTPVTFRLNVVPEPASAILLATILIAIRRR